MTNSCGTTYLVGEVVVDNDIQHAHFQCDTARCKGACCSLVGGRGAPLEEDEVAEIHRSLPFITQYLSPEHLGVIERQGPVEGNVGDRVTPCIDDRACVYVYYDGDIARCSFERAYLEGKTSWRKPLSCHLFPLRIKRSSSDYLHYEQLDECSPGRERGREGQTRMADFLREPLTRKYGASWYERFRNSRQTK